MKVSLSSGFIACAHDFRQLWRGGLERGGTGARILAHGPQPAPSFCQPRRQKDGAASKHKARPIKLIERALDRLS